MSGRYFALEELGSARTMPKDSTSRAHRWRDGYHMGLVGCMATAACVLILNCSLTIAAKAKHDIEGVYGILQQGDCNKTKRLDLWLHFLINVLSTLLLGASNYTMQCLSAPTREELDNAHMQGRWLDIGVPSIRNLASIAPSRRVLWILLLLSSIPLHLLYNSVVFASTSYAQWQAFAVTEDFLSGTPYIVSDSLSSPNPDWNITRSLDRFRDDKSLVHLDNNQCLQAYSPALEFAWSSVLIVTAQENANNSFLNVIATNEADSMGPSDWSFCTVLPSQQANDCFLNQTIDPSNLPLDATGSPLVAYCLAIPANQHCQVRFRLDLMIVVIVCNCIKVVCIWAFAFRMESPPLVTLGDVLSSILARPGE